MPFNRQVEDLEFSHFALIYIDQNGILRHEVSQSLMDSRDIIFTPRVKDEFFRAIAHSTGLAPTVPLCDPVASAQISTQTPSCQTVIEHVFCLAQIGYDHHVTNSRGTKGHVQDSMIPRPPIQPEQRPQHQNKPTRISSNQEAFISITDKGFLRRYYEKIWENFQQTNCRVLAKAYVKLIEPRKQVTYPYNGRKIIAGKTHQLDPNETKPPWWPTGVSHREPDHLPKAERIRLLVYILCEMRTSYGITAHKLKAAEQHIRTQIFPTERLGLLDEVYRVREAEERFQDGFIDGKAMISISRSNVPDSAEGVIRPGKRNQTDIPVDKRPTSKKAKPKQLPSCGGSSSKTEKNRALLRGL
ncbi:hypothetical protein N7494_005495 [Penicillium frequentans]|uniref:Subtelomeric hrmA-associated cluster protein AFUB-079030/YDR124W-like helical bundle domain-containing protein n=1 Tax=Penicillium frequentans TaxID=3151616 RepID=A0AAD6GEE1_9EURO|nr:hypothetical protein N7494_005495 [Penicillium glabrum]